IAVLCWTGLAGGQPAGTKPAAPAPSASTPAPAAPVAQTPSEPPKSVSEQINQAQTWVKKLVDDLLGLLAKYGLRVLGALVVLAIAFILAGWAKRATRLGLDRAHFDPTITKFGSNVVRYLVLILGVLTCAPIMGIDITAFAAVLGVGGLAVGL